LNDLPKDPSSRVIIVKIESTSSTDADDAVAMLKREHGITAIDVAIANAGISKEFPRVHEVQPKQMLEHFNVNVIGVVHFFRAVRPLLLEAAAKGKNARFVSMSSTAGSIATQPQFALAVPNAAYGPSKAALNWVTMKIHVENLDAGLCTIALHPG
jgi:norsolorinic acid ketoreductase